MGRGWMFILSQTYTNLTEAEEEAASRQVHATHARIVSESVPEPATRRRLDIAISKTTQKLKGIQTLSPAEQEAADIMKENTEQPLTSSSFSVPSDY
ncbi:hypothetical protein Tco_0074474, partial [Tanacetum coccineum]